MKRKRHEEETNPIKVFGVSGILSYTTGFIWGYLKGYSGDHKSVRWAGRALSAVSAAAIIFTTVHLSAPVLLPYRGSEAAEFDASIAQAAGQRQDLEEKAADSDAIEKTLPVVRLVLEQKEWCRENKIYVSATDRQPTEDRYVCNETGEDSGWIIESSKTVSRNGDWKVQVRDAAGNVVEKEITVDNIDTQAPVIRSITEK